MSTESVVYMFGYRWYKFLNVKELHVATGIYAYSFGSLDDFEKLLMEKNVYFEHYNPNSEE